MIYADHAATTKLDMSAFEAMKPFLTEEYGNASQPYSFSRAPKTALREARETIASCIGSLPEEILFTSGGTESDNWVIKGTERNGTEKRTIVTSSIEHHAVLHSCRAAEMCGTPVVYLIPNSEGVILPESFERALSSRTRLASIMFANNEIGSIQPIQQLAQISHQHGALFHTDAVQAVGHVPLNVARLGVDMLSASAHKFNGPKGIGFLYVKKGVDLNSYIDGGAQEFGMRAGTENIAYIVGMAAALKKSCEDLESRAAHLRQLEKLLLSELNRIPLDFKLNTPENHIPGNMSFSFKDAEGEMILHRLDLMGVCVSTGSACNSKSTELSHVIKAIQVPLEYAYGTIRISLGYENTSEEVVYIAKCLQQILKR